MIDLRLKESKFSYLSGSKIQFVNDSPLNLNVFNEI